MTQSEYPLFQFWDKELPPEEVTDLMGSWKQEPGFAYRRFSLTDADTLIAEHFDRQTLDAFRDCAVPAMQADFFRYAALYVFGGAYVDADTGSNGGFASMCDESDRGLLMNRRGNIANDVIFVRKPRDPLMLYAVRTATSNVVNRIANNVWRVTGPGILTHLYRSDAEEKDALFAGFSIENNNLFKAFVHFQWEMEYKDGEEDWRKRSGDDAPSIFRSAQ